MKIVKTADWWKIGIICISFFLRVFRLESLTEFLGDQGRTMLVMRDFLEGGTIPLIGPSTLSGHNLGPVFYYLLAPGYIGGPVGMSLLMVLYGVLAVFFLYEVSYLMFGKWPARLSSLLWAVSPLIIYADRVIWEPNLVPFFSVLFVYLLYKGHGRWHYGTWASLGAVAGVLIQLHYPNVFFVGLTLLYFIGSVVLRHQAVVRVCKAGLWWVLGFVVAMSPFLIYEYTHGFENIGGIASIIVGSTGLALGKRAMLLHVVDYAFRVFGQALPYMKLTMAPWLIAAWICFVLFRPTRKNVFFSIWFFGGLVAMAKYTEVVYDHYLNFLTPVPFLVIGSVLHSVRNKRVKNIVGACVFFLCVLQLTHADIFARGNNDIARLDSVTAYIKSIVGEAPFSFTLIRSRSYSDLHYRYYMKVMNVTPVPFTDDSHQKFILICDHDDCPSVAEVTAMPEVPVLCYEEHCKEYYPKIPLMREWKYETDITIGKKEREYGRLYVFGRR